MELDASPGAMRLKFFFRTRQRVSEQEYDIRFLKYVLEREVHPTYPRLARQFGDGPRTSAVANPSVFIFNVSVS